MFRNETSDVSRRNVLKRAATVGALGLGSAVAASPSAAASQSVEEVDVDLDLSKGALPGLERYGVVAQQEEIPVSISEAIRTGHRLVETLRADGLLKAKSLNAVAARADDVYGVRVEGALEIGFEIQTESGRLQVTFSESGPAFAAFYPDDGSEIRIYTTPDGETYEQIVQEPEVGTAELPCEWWCGGCTCESSICWVGIKKSFCQNCTTSGCKTTSNCGC